MSTPRRIAFMLDLDWPYKRHSGVFAGAQKYAQECGWHTIIDEYADYTLAAVKAGDPLPYDGVVARMTVKLATHAKRLGLPVVNVWFSSPAWKMVPGVYTDYPALGRLRAEHLLSRGFRNFATVIQSENRGQALELKAFNDRLADAGFKSTSTVVPLTNDTVHEWRKTVKSIVAAMDVWKPPVGVYISSEQEARLVVQMCQNRGWRVPQDVAIITGANEVTYCEGLRPTLSSVEFGYERVGYEAAKLLNSLMDGDAPPKAPILIPPTGIVVRESTDFYAVDDALIAEALQFIATHCHKAIGAEDVALAVKTELRTLQRHFRKHLDRPIATEIRRVRIERAKRELVQGNRTLAEIAHDVGFGETMRMYEVFRRELGVTPGQYRKDRKLNR